MTRKLEQPIRRVITHLVAGDYRGLESLTRGHRLSAEEMKTAVEDYGSRLVPPPDHAFESDLDAIPIMDAVPPAWSVIMTLWTEEEGRSDLSIVLTVMQREDDFDITIDDIHVL